MTLMCNVSGMPTPMVSWMTPYSQRVSGYKLEVRKINRSQAGEYKCEPVTSVTMQQRWQPLLCSVSMTVSFP